ncbi:hypothetical protein K4F52_003405 [Lecanicillium sp. MT-2017a]|nr:hypothetical protein K4F52_003405 [Lecanicillium sp. MT-2017a]
MEQTHHPPGQFPGLESALAALADNPESLDRARSRFSDSPPSYRSQESTAFPSPELSSEEEHERMKWDLIQRHSASLPREQFTLQVRTEYERIKQHSAWRGKPMPEGMDMYSFAEKTVIEDWRRQGICRRGWRHTCVCDGRWKHEEPLDLDSDTEETLYMDNMLGFRPTGRAGIPDAMACASTHFQALRKHNSEMSRPYHQFLWQVALERQFLTFKLRQPEPRWSFSRTGEPLFTLPQPNTEDLEESLSTLPPDLNTIAYENVRDRWIDQGLYLEEWGALPGFTWLHEIPLAEFLRDELGDDVLIPTSIFQGGPISEEEVARRRQSLRLHAMPGARDTGLFGSGPQVGSQTGLFGSAPQVGSQSPIARHFANGGRRHFDEQAGRDRRRNIFDPPSRSPTPERTPERPEPRVAGSGLFTHGIGNVPATGWGYPQRSGPVPNNLFLNPVGQAAERPGLFSGTTAIGQEDAAPTGLFGTRQTATTTTTANIPDAYNTNSRLFSPRQTLFSGPRDDINQQPAQTNGDHSHHGSPNLSPSTRPSSPGSTVSSYKTGRSTTSHTSTSNQKRSADDSTLEEQPANKTRSTTRSRTQTRAESQASSSKRRTAPAPPVQQPRPKRRQQAPRAAAAAAATNGKKNGANGNKSKNGHVSPTAAAAPAQRLRRSPRLKKMKEEKGKKKKTKK